MWGGGASGFLKGRGIIGLMVCDRVAELIRAIEDMDVGFASTTLSSSVFTISSSSTSCASTYAFSFSPTLTSMLSVPWFSRS